MTFTFDRETHIYRIDGRVLPSVTQVLEVAGFIDKRWYTEESRDFGSMVHDMVFLWNAGLLDEDALDPALKPRLDALKRFRADKGLSVLWAERPLFHPVYHYAGTPDIVGQFVDSPHCWALIDVKSGIPQPWVEIQLGAYEMLVRPELERIAKKDVLIKRYALHLKGDGTYSLMPCTDAQAGQVFLSALACCQWKTNHGGENGTR